MCCDFKESCIFAVVKHWIEGEGHRRSLFIANVLHGSWILVRIGLAEKCHLH